MTPLKKFKNLRVEHDKNNRTLIWWNFITKYKTCTATVKIHRRPCPRAHSSINGWMFQVGWMESYFTSPQREITGSFHIFSGIKLTNKKHHGELNSWLKPSWPIHPFMLKWARGQRAAMYLDRDCTSIQNTQKIPVIKIKFCTLDVTNLINTVYVIGTWMRWLTVHHPLRRTMKRQNYTVWRTDWARLDSAASSRMPFSPF